MYFKLAVGNVRKSIRDYGVYFITLVFGVCVFYAFNSMTTQSAVLDLSETQSNIIGLLSMVIAGVSVFVAVILGFLIVYASRYLIRRRKQEFGTYLLLGMSPSRVSRIIVYETLLVGILSLVVGLFLGILVSQALLYITAAMFTVTMNELTFVFSPEAFILTIIAFAIVFLIALCFSVLSVARYKLIDLINADRINEGLKLRSIPLSVALFLVSVAIIIISYLVLFDNGMQTFDAQFGLATALVCIGTLLFFYSLSGFLLRAIQSSKRLYYRALNMFTLRQLNAKINTAFFSISLVCLALFLAITSSCGGFALATTFTQNLERTTIYDASFTSYLAGSYRDEITEEAQTFINQAAEDDFDMEAALSRDVAQWDDLVKESAQISFYQSDITMQDIFDNSNEQTVAALGFEAKNTNEYLVPLVRLSDYNDLRALTDLEPLTLEENEYLLWADFNDIERLLEEYLAAGTIIEIAGHRLNPSSEPLQNTSAQTSSLGMNTGTIIVNDELIADDQTIAHTTLNVMYNGSREEIEPAFYEAIVDAYHESEEAGLYSLGWPFSNCLTALEMQEQNTGFSAVIAYLAVYIGMVLLIACAAILALQQLSEAADNVARYRLLEKIGTDRGMINKALFVQIGIYFLFPLVLALCHALCALSVVVDIISTYGHIDITGPLISTLVLFLAIYGGYFLITYFASRNMIQSKAKA